MPRSTTFNTHTEQADYSYQQGEYKYYLAEARHEIGSKADTVYNSIIVPDSFVADNISSNGLIIMDYTQMLFNTRSSLSGILSSGLYMFYYFSIGFQNTSKVKVYMEGGIASAATGHTYSGYLYGIK